MTRMDEYREMMRRHRMEVEGETAEEAVEHDRRDMARIKRQESSVREIIAEQRAAGRIF